MVKAIYTGSEFVDSATSSTDVGIILESTSFYAEQGGQVHPIHLYSNWHIHHASYQNLHRKMKMYTYLIIK